MAKTLDYVRILARHLTEAARDRRFLGKEGEFIQKSASFLTHTTKSSYATETGEKTCEGGRHIRQGKNTWGGSEAVAGKLSGKKGTWTKN